MRDRQSMDGGEMMGRCRHATVLLFCALAILIGVVRAGENRSGLASNANFNVLADTQGLADKVSERANVLRTEIAKQWLGATIPDGFGPASINVFFSEKNASRTWLMDEEGQRDAHLIWIYTPPEDLDTALAHEIAHVVLANRYTDLPAFAHEAIASSYDGEKRREIRANTLRWFVETNRWPSLRRLFVADQIDAANHSQYTASISVKDFLLSRSEGDHKKFLQFAAHGKEHGWDATMARYYGISNVATCEAEWRRWVKSQVSTR
jgi:hypothetical protein